jgi:benzoate-CoA ligase
MDKAATEAVVREVSMAYPRAYNAAADLIDRNLAAGRGDKPAFIDPADTLTYGALALRSNQMGNLLATYGIPRESRVALMLLDTVDFPVAFLGAIKAGVIPVALNTLLTSEQYAYILADARAKAVFISAPLLSVLQPILNRLPDLKHIFVAGGETPPYALSFRTELAAQPTTFACADTCCDETAFWLYSSGSTGMPKGVRHVHTSLMETARLTGQGCLGVKESDVVYSAAKLFFAYGLGNALTFPLSVGATVILMAERPTPEAVFKRLVERQPTVFFGVPTLFAGMLASPALPSRESVRLRRCASAGEALPREIGERFDAHFGCPILDGIGSTEMLHIFISNAPDALRYGTSGRPVPGYEMQLLDENGAPVPVGEVGDLYVKGDSSALMYWGNREKSRATFLGAWTRTGDKYVRDAQGWYTYAGRSDDMLKVSGQYVSPFEVESCLMQHETVLEAALIGITDEDGLTKSKAFVVLKDGVEPSDTLAVEIKRFVKERLAPHKYPRRIDFIGELPKTPTGKIQRFKLRDRERHAMREPTPA